MLAAEYSLLVERSLLFIALLSLALAAVAGCYVETANEDAMPNRDITAVMDAHVEELMALPGVTGVALGETDEGTPCILILIREDSDSIKAQLPSDIEGHPVRTLVTGEIVPMQGD